MVANFGPVRRQGTIHYQEVKRLSISRIPEKDAQATLLPEPFEPADEPAQYIAKWVQVMATK